MKISAQIRLRARSGRFERTIAICVCVFFLILTVSEKKNFKKFLCVHSASSPHSPEPCLLTDQSFTNNF